MPTFKLRRGTAAEWAASNPVLAEGEPGFERDTNKHKIGDGVTLWSELEYFISESALKATFAELPAGISDGRLLAYDSVTGQMIATNPYGSSELAVAVNETGVSTSLPTGTPGAIVTIPATAISVGDSNGRNVTLCYQAAIRQTVSGEGAVFLLLYETTGGSSSLISFTAGPLPNLAPLTLSLAPVPPHAKRIGAVTTTRTFELGAYVYSTTANTAAMVINAANQPTMLRAIAG